MKTFIFALIAFTTFQAFAEDISPGLRLVFQAANLSKIRNTGDVCGDKEVYQGIIIEKLQEALKLEPTLRSKIAGDPDIRKAMGMTLNYHELIGNLKGMNGIEKALGQAYFEGAGQGAYGPAVTMQLSAKGGEKTLMVDIDPQPTYKKSSVSWKVLSKTATTAKVKLDGEVYTLKKIDGHNIKEFILESKADANEEYKGRSLFNLKSECDA